MFRRFQSEPLTNGIPYGKSGYAGSATLYEIEVLRLLVMIT